MLLPGLHYHPGRAPHQPLCFVGHHHGQLQKERVSNKPSQQASVQLENGFALLLQDPGSQTLIVGDFAIKDVKGKSNNNTKTYRSPKDVVSGITARILHPQL